MKEADEIHSSVWEDESGMSQKLMLQARLDEYMRDNGLKSTRQRQAIFDVFIETTDHLSLDQLLVMVQERMPGIGYATVYRTMKLLTDAGVAHERRFHEGSSQYEPVDLSHDHHDHLICSLCGHIFEFEDDIIEERQRLVAQQFGIRLTRHRLELWGDCMDPSTCERRKPSVS